MSAYDGRFSTTFARLRFSAWIAFAVITLPSFLCLSSASAQQFVVAPEYSTGHEPQFAASGDFNGDGKEDLVTSNVLANTVSVLINKGDGTFQPHKDFATGVKPEQVVVADFNGDLKPDVAVVNHDNANVSVLLALGDGTFETHVDYPTGNGPVFIAVADVNGDGAQDLAVGNFGEHTVSILLGNGDGTFQAQVKYSLPGTAQSVAVGDFNGDSKPDLAIPITEASICAISILPGKGDGTFRPPVNSTTNCGTRAAVGDLNRDGKTDVVLACNVCFDAYVGVLLGNGDGTLQRETDYLTESSPWSVSVVDINGDGDPDLVLALPDNNAVDVILGKGDGTLGAPHEYGAGRGGIWTEAGDFDGDGNADVATANAFADTMTVLIGRGDGSFFARRDYGGGFFPLGIAAGDLNHDSIVDVVVADGSTQGFVSVLLGRSEGTFAPTVTYPAGSNLDSVTIGDFNGDSHPDIAAAMFGGTSVALLLGKGDGTFQPPVDIPMSSPSTGIAAADLNGDGKLDLVVVTGEVVVLLGNGDGTFQPETDYSAGALVTSVAIADFNGDGKWDLVVTDFPTGGTPVASVLLGNGDGTFKPHVDYPVASQPFGIAAADLNGDGKQDLVVATGESNDVGSISVLLGNGDGTFRAHQDYSASSLVLSVAIGDFTGDGFLDVAVTNSNSASVGVFAGKGDGTFPKRIDYTVGGGAPTGVVVADFNRDRKPDVAVTSNTVSALLNASPVPWFSLSARTGGSGTGIVKFSPGGVCGRSCSKTFASGTSIALTAVADSGSTFSGWSGGGCSGTGNCNLTLTSDQTVTATFDLTADFSLSVSDFAPNPISPGQSSTATISAEGANGFSDTVSLTCSVQPSPAHAPQCSVSPTSIKPGNSATATIITTAPTGAQAALSGSASPLFNALWLPIAGLTFAGIIISAPRDRKARLLSVLFGFVLVAGVVFQAACGGSGNTGGGGGGTPPGTYTITIAATSGSLTHSTQGTLKVQ